jgi:gamma-glutamyltranspeptidase/glutathione hydrolase
MDFNPSLYHYPSRRNTVYARNVVAASHPLAVQAGMRIMQNGGNAIDAAIAVAAMLPVVEPTANGIGGDAFARVWADGKLHSLNASGYAPAALTAEKVLAKGYKAMPVNAWEAVTIPGAPSAWAALNKRFGKLKLTDVMKPAIDTARYGHPLSPDTGGSWKRAYKHYREVLKGEQFKYWFDTFAPGGRCPDIGEVWKSNEMAATLELLAETDCEAFYRGEIANDIAAYAKKYGGYISEADLNEYYPEWVNSAHINYKGYDIHEIPPNGQGMTALIALQILKGLELDETRETERNYHLQIEAMKLAFADATAYITDSRHMTVKPEDLLSDAYASERRKLIGESASTYVHGTPEKGGTVYFATADADGNMVSYIQSNYNGFGSGLTVPGRGVTLHNRGSNFSLEDGHPNRLAPRKKPYHTIIPGFVTKDGHPIGPFGVMGGFMQPQAHVQVILNAADFRLNPQDILDAPRWQWNSGKQITLENFISPEIIEGLSKRGHQISVAPYGTGGMGRGQIIWRQPNGVYCAGSEPRADGMTAGC